VQAARPNISQDASNIAASAKRVEKEERWLTCIPVVRDTWQAYLDRCYGLGRSRSRTAPLCHIDRHTSHADRRGPCNCKFLEIGCREIHWIDKREREREREAAQIYPSHISSLLLGLSSSGFPKTLWNRFSLLFGHTSLREMRRTRDESETGEKLDCQLPMKFLVFLYHLPRPLIYRIVKRNQYWYNLCRMNNSSSQQSG
jgi:hypothetical protein